MAGYSGAEGHKRAVDFQQALYIMTDLRIIQRCLEVFVESNALKRHIVDHLLMCGIWYDKICQKLSLAPAPDKTAILIEVMEKEIEDMKRTRRDYYSNFYLN